MKSSIYSALYRLDTDGYEHEVLHLYEHLVLKRALDMLQADGMNTRYFGSVKATTYGKRIFVDVCFYNQHAMKLFSDFLLHAPSHINLDDIADELRRLESEKRILFTVTDTKKLHSQLLALDALQWKDVEDDMSPPVLEPFFKPPAPNVMTFRHSAKSFRDIGVGVYIEDITAEEMALFSRMTSIIDYIVSRPMTELGAYPQEWIDTYISPEKIGGTGARFSVHRGACTTKEVRARVEQAIQSFDVRQWQEMEAFFDIFVRDAYFSDSPLDYYDNTAVVTSRRQIRQLATHQNIDDLFKRMRVRVVPIN